MRKAGWREYMIGIILLIAGSIYLVIQVIAMLKGDGSAVSSDQDLIHINKYEALNQLRTLITILACLFGGVLLIMQRKFGWMLALTMLLLFGTVASAGLSSLVQIRLFDTSFFIAAFGCLVFLFLLAMLFSLAKKFMLKENDWIRAILLCMLLGVIYFFLQ